MFELQGAKFYSNEKDLDPKINFRKKQAIINLWKKTKESQSIDSPHYF